MRACAVLLLLALLSACKTDLYTKRTEAEANDMVAALRLAGVPVQLELYRGVTHDFIKMGRQIPEALTALEACGQALKDAFRA